MDDLVYRRMAIDIAMQYCPDDDGSCSKGDRDIRELLDDLENLPSAQPEITRCSECRYAIRSRGKPWICKHPDNNAWRIVDDFYCGRAKRREDEERKVTSRATV